VTATNVLLRGGGALRHHRRHVPSVRTRSRLACCVPLAAALLLAAAPAGVQARGGDRAEVRASGVCGKGATAKLRLRARDGGIRARFEVDHHRSGVSWRVVLIQDRRVIWRGRARTGGPSASFEVERRLRDLPGADQVTARASGPGGLTCSATATLPG
jgi:hypothetical protein